MLKIAIGILMTISLVSVNPSVVHADQFYHSGFILIDGKSHGAMSIYFDTDYQGKPLNKCMLNENYSYYAKSIDGDDYLFSMHQEGGYYDYFTNRYITYTPVDSINNNLPYIWIVKERPCSEVNGIGLSGNTNFVFKVDCPPGEDYADYLNITFRTSSDTDTKTLLLNGIAASNIGYYTEWEIYGQWTLSPPVCGSQFAFSPTTTNDNWNYIRFSGINFGLSCDIKIGDASAESTSIDPKTGGSIAISGNIASLKNIEWNLQLPGGQVISGSGGQVSVNWKGMNTSGVVLPEGNYTAKLIAKTNNGRCTASKDIPITIKHLCKIDLTNFDVYKTTIDPSLGEKVTFPGSISANRDYSWIINVAGRTFYGSGSPSVAWDGKDASGNIVEDATYIATLNVQSTPSECSASTSFPIEVKKRDSGNNPPEICDFASSANVVTGGISHSQELFALKGGRLPANVSLYYDSLAPRTGPINKELLHHFQKVLQFQGDGSISYQEWDRTRTYILSGTGYLPPAGETSTLVKNADGTYVITEVDGTINTFNPSGKITTTIESSGKQYTFTYTADSVTITDPTKWITTFSSLYYNALNPMTGSLGTGWSHSYEIAIQDQGNGAMLFKNGKTSRLYTRSGDAYLSPAGDFSIFMKNTDGTFSITEKDGLKHNFDQWGRIVARTDNNGNTKTFAYDGGPLSKVTDEAGRSLAFEYDTTGKLGRITDPTGNNYTFNYTGENLASITQPDGGQWNYTYDTAGYLLSKSDPGGNVTTYFYDDNHRILEGTDPEGKARKLSYAQDTTSSVWAATFTEKDGGTWLYAFDTTAGTLTSKTDPYGNTIAYTYDSRKNMLTKSEAGVITETYTYDLNDNVTSVTKPLGNVTNYTYNDRGQVLTVSDPEGTTINTYDANDNILTTTDPAGAITSYEYDARGNMIKVTDAKGQVITMTYDDAGLLSSTTDPTGAVTASTYNANGNLMTQTDPTGKVTSFEYDGMNRLVKVTNPLGNITTYRYDKMGNRTTITDANGNTTSYKYNYRRQVIESRDPQGNVTTYTYGSTGCKSCSGGVDKLTALTDAKGQTTSWQYDLLGRLLHETDPLQKMTVYQYDTAGNMTYRTDANDVAVSYDYDPLKRLTGKSYPDGSRVSYTYDTAGHIQSATNANISYSYIYDAGGRTTSITDSRGFTINYEYDQIGNRTKMISPDGKITTYTYDSLNRLSNIGSPFGVFTFEHDNMGRRTRVINPNGTISSATYDAAGRLTSLKHATSRNVTIDSVTHTYDGVGNRLTRTEPTKNFSYLYDPLYRILQITANIAEYNEVFTYDPVGNRLTGPLAITAYVYAPGNELMSKTGVSYQYDNNGNLIAKTDGTTNWIYSYDYENRLTKVVKNAGTTATTVTFKYDPFGRRIEKSVTTGKKNVTNRYLYDGDNILYEYQTNNTIAARYIHALAIDDPLGLEKHGKLYIYHKDGLGSITAITDSREDVVQSYAYNSFGNIVSKNSTTFEQQHTYTGREWDKETGLYYYRARYYDPIEGRFINRDPIGYRGGINLFSYVQNNPVMRIDPFGLFGPGGQDAEYPGHSNFSGCNDFDYNLEDKDPATRPIPILGDPERHFRDLPISESDVLDAVEVCDKDAFQRAMHRGQDFFSHFSKGYRWKPLGCWKNLGFGHGLDGSIPDHDVDAWGRAEIWSKIWLKKWNDKCQCKE